MVTLCFRGARRLFFAAPITEPYCALNAAPVQPGYYIGTSGIIWTCLNNTYLPATVWHFCSWIHSWLTFLFFLCVLWVVIGLCAEATPWDFVKAVKTEKNGTIRILNWLFVDLLGYFYICCVSSNWILLLRVQDCLSKVVLKYNTSNIVIIGRCKYTSISISNLRFTPSQVYDCQILLK